MGGWVGKNANLVRIKKTIGIYGRPLTVKDRIYFGTGPLQCLRVVPQRLKVLILYIITIDLMQ